MIKNLNEFVSKLPDKPALQCLLVDAHTIVATDSFKLIEIEHETGVKKPFLMKMPKGAKDYTDAIKLDDGMRLDVESYPKYKNLFPKKTPRVFVRLHPDHLMSIVKAFTGKKDEDVWIDIEISDIPNTPVIFKGKGKRALLAQIYH